MRFLSLIFVTTLLFFASCDTPTPPPPTPPVEVNVKVPTFNEQNAYNNVEKQVKFGPRVPNSAPHKACADWMIEALKGYGLTVKVQEFKVRAYDGTNLNARNIIASYNPDAKDRIMLSSHWDTRPFSDHDENAANHKKQFDGADDGASGVGILMEVAAILKDNPIEMGVDIMLWDVEDYGASGQDIPNSEMTWCLGSQYWSRNQHVPDYKPRFGILLDMVGAKNARFPKEGTSMRWASDIVTKVWKEAQNSGYGLYFVNDLEGDLIDDHKVINELAGIPTIDIINLSNEPSKTFGAHWHTQNDNMSVINKQSLKAVGQTLLQVIYKEDALLKN